MASKYNDMQSKARNHKDDLRKRENIHVHRNKVECKRSVYKKENFGSLRYFEDILQYMRNMDKIIKENKS